MNENILDIKIGTKEQPILKPLKVMVKDIRLDEKRGDFKLIVIICKHPDKEELIELSNAKIMSKDKLKLSALWFNKDEEGNLNKKSIASEVLRFYNVQTFGELKNKEIETIPKSEMDNYLCIKAY